MVEILLQVDLIASGCAGWGTGREYQGILDQKNPRTYLGNFDWGLVDEIGCLVEICQV